MSGNGSGLGLFVGNPNGPVALQLCGSILTRVTSGPTQLVPAAPAGYFNVLSALRIANEHATNTMDVTVQDVDGILYAQQGTLVVPARGAGTDPAAASSVVVSSALPIVSSGAITCTVNSGGPAMVQAHWALLPTAGITYASLVLTAAYQSVAVIPVDSSKVNALLGTVGPYGLIPSGFGSAGAVVMNNDTASMAWVLRHTRGATVSVFTSAAFVSARSRGGAFTTMGPFIAGDVFEVKCVSAPAVAGSQVARFFYMSVPLQT